MTHAEHDESLNTLPLLQADRGSIPASARLACLLAWLGVLVSVVLASRENTLRSFLCPVYGGCEAVLASKYADLRGIPLPWLGFLFYLVALGSLLAVCTLHSRRIRLCLLDGILWLEVVGLTFSAGLMYVQFGMLHAFCPLCTASALIVAGLLVATIRARRVVEVGDADASPGEALTLALFAIFPVAIFLASHLEPGRASVQFSLMDLSTAHRAGPADAPVQVVVFSDFQCGFCRQLAPVLSRVHSEFPQDVAVVYCHFPLEMHPRAFAAAVAAECAGEQGAFWKYHDKLFSEGGDLGEARLLALAASLGLDEARFAACLHSEKPRREVDANLREAAQLGLEGVPVVFLNGRRVEAPLTYENLTRHIKESLLARTGGTAPAK